MRMPTGIGTKADDLDAFLSAVNADLVKERGLEQSCVPPLDGTEHAVIARRERGSSVRRIVDTILRDRDVHATRN